MTGRTAITAFLLALFVMGCGESSRELAQTAYQRGLSESKGGNYKEALKHFSKATSLDPKMAIAYRGRGYILGKMGQPTKAKAEYEKAIQVDPKFALAYLSRGRLYLDEGKLDAAIEDFSTVIRLQPFPRVAYRYRGIAKYKKRQLDKALLDFNRAIEISNKHPESFFQRGMIHLDKGEYQQAVSDFGNAVWLNSKHAESYCRRGWANFELGKYDIAIKDSEKAISLDSNLADAYCNLARIYAMAGDDKVRDGKKAVKFGKLACRMTQLKSWCSLAAAAAAYAETGDFKRAVKLQEMAIGQARQATRDSQKQLAEGLALFKKKKPVRKIPPRETDHIPEKIIMTGST